MQNPHDLNLTGNGEIEDDVTPYRKAAQTIGQLVPSSPDTGLVRKHLELLVDQIDECIGMGVAVIGDVLPQFNKISLGTGLDNNHLDASRALGDGGAGRLAPASVLLDLLRIPEGRLATAESFLDVVSQLLELERTQLVLLLHEPEGFADDLAGGGVEARRDLGLHHGFELRREADIHGHDDLHHGPLS